MSLDVPNPLEASQARWLCSIDSFDLEEDPVPEELQQRAISALRFGIAAGHDFHLVAVGSNRIGIQHYLNWLLEESLDSLPPCCDWCYVMNFEDHYKPLAIRLPTGEGRHFKEGIENAINDLQSDIPQAFETDPYADRRDTLLQDFSNQRDEVFESLQRRAAELGFQLVQGPAGLIIAPVRDGRPISPEEFQQLPPEVQARLEQGRVTLGSDLERSMRRIRDINDQARQAVRELDEGIARDVVQHRLFPLRERYADHGKVQTYLDAVEEDIVSNLGMFREGPMQAPDPMTASRMAMMQEEFFRRYAVNLIVDHSGEDSPTVVHEDNPNYGNLVGKIERRGVMGTLVTDFTMIKAGALLRANEGFLVLDLRDLLTHPLSWEALKHALERETVRIEEIGQMTGMIATTSLEPEPIPLTVKVILIGDVELVNTVAAIDPEFNRLFKIRSEFQPSVTRNDKMTRALASYFFALETHERPPLDRSGVGKLLEHSARLAGDQRRLSVELEPLTDIAREAMQVAADNGGEHTDGAAVREAIELRRYRARYAADRLRQLLVDRTIMIDTEGEVVGQINGLTVMSASGFTFGSPVRITARAFAGRGGIVDIEREVELGGPIHSKGVFILYGYLGGLYGAERPISLSASLVFEQTYTPVEGDSASLAELCALISSLAEVPIKQGLAVTGSVNQRGEVQAIGGVNEKVEGFFDLCNERGLTGDQGVVIPRSNVPNLMLREDVLEAIDRDEFHIYPVSTTDEALHLITGMPAGVPGDGADSLHGRAAERLAEFAEATQSQWRNADA